jgi:hypothetical protein
MRSVCKNILFTACLFSTLFAIGTQFLAVPVSAVELGLGRHPTMKWGFNINPAVLSHYNGGAEVSFSLGEWLTDVNTSAVTVVAPVFGNTGGVQLRYVGLNDLELRSSIPSDEPLGRFDAYGTALDLSYAFHKNGLNFGAAMHTLHMQIYTESAAGLAIDVGVLYEVNNGLILGGSILNIGKTGKLYKKNPALPLRITGGIAYPYQTGNLKNTGFLSGEYAQINNQVIIKVGNESNWNGLSLRINSQVAKNSTSYGGGVGFSVGLYQFNYGLNFDSKKLGTSQLITVLMMIP